MTTLARRAVSNTKSSTKSSLAGVRPGCVVAVRLDARHSRESFAVAVESNGVDNPGEARRIKHEVAHEVVTDIEVRPVLSNLRRERSGQRPEPGRSYRDSMTAGLPPWDEKPPGRLFVAR